MERNTFFCNLGLYIKSVLVLILLLGGSSSAWADTVIFDGKSDISDWTKTGFTYSTYLYYLGYNNSNGLLTSNNKYTITSSHKIVINAKNFIGGASGAIEVQCSSDKSSWTRISKIETLTDDFADYKINLTDGSYYLQIVGDYVRIGAITIEDPVIAEPILSVTPNESASFGERESSTSKVYTVTNSGGGTLNVTIAKASGDSEFGVSKTSITGLGAGDSETFNITYTYNGESLGDKAATITVTPETGDAVNISASATTLKANDPHISVTPAEDATFGEVTANQTKTYTVTNTGTGLMSVNITNTNTTDFEISKTSISDLARNESETFTVTFNYDSESLGDKAATITVTPTYKEADAVTISASATSTNAKAFEEDFSSGIPSSWYNEDGIWRTNIYSHTGQAGQNTQNKLDKTVLRTPRLYAESGQTLTFDVSGSGTRNLIAEYSSDRISWTEIGDYTEDGTKSFTATSTGYLWIRFKAYMVYLDNVSGFSLADNIHEMNYASSTVPTSGTRLMDYTASIDLMELGGSGETVNVELWFDGVKVAEKEETINGNQDKKVELTFIPTTAKTGIAYIKVYNSNINLQTDNTDVTIAEPELTFDEDNTSPSWSTVYSNKTALIKYNAKEGWNTIALPFYWTNKDTWTADMNKFFGTNWTAYKLNSYSNGTIGFTKVTTYFNARNPYIIYATSVPSNPEGRTILANATIYGSSTANSNSVTKGDATFTGTYAKLTSMPENSYGLTTSGQIKKAGSGASIKGFRGYFTGISAPSEGARITIVFEDEEGTTTDLGFVKMVDPEAEHVYTLSGQKVQKGKKGIYIVNGRKVVIK